MKLLSALALALALAAPTWPQKGKIPRFEDYPAKTIFKGPPAAPKLNKPLERMYQAKIHDALQKAPGPNFAGKMIVVNWSCGTPCLQMALVDAETGAVFYPPLSALGSGSQNFLLPNLAPGSSPPQDPDVKYRLDSRLMIVSATPLESAQHASFTYYFLWQGSRFNLLKKVPLKPAKSG